LIVPAPVMTTRFMAPSRGCSAISRSTAATMAATDEMSKPPSGVVGVERHRDVEGFLDGKDRLDQPQAVDPEAFERGIGAARRTSSTACSAMIAITLSFHAPWSWHPSALLRVDLVALVRV
jgi:hypothetical protein